jgi:hypothetical protein
VPPATWTTRNTYEDWFMAGGFDASVSLP